MRNNHSKLTVAEAKKREYLCHNFYGSVRINRRSSDKTAVIVAATNALIKNIAFDIKKELDASGINIMLKSIFEEVESIKEELRSIIEYFYDHGFSEDKFLNSDEFEKYWHSNMEDDWQHGICTVNKLLYFRPCCITVYKNGFSIEFND